MAVVRLLSININVFVDSAESKWRTELMRLIGRHATDNLACKMSTRGESLSCYRLASVYLPASRSGCQGNRLPEKVIKTDYYEGGGGSVVGGGGGSEGRRLDVECRLQETQWNGTESG